MNCVLIAAGIVLFAVYDSVPALGLTAVGINNLLAYRWKNPKTGNYVNIGIALLVAVFYLSEEWLPMGPQRGLSVNVLFVAGLRCHHSGFTLDTGHFLRAYFALVSGQSLEVYDDSCSNRRLWFPHLAGYRAGIYAQPERRLFSIDAYQYASYGY